MKESIVYESSSLYREPFRITGYCFGEGEKSLCVLGSIRGNEIQQIYTCSLLTAKLKELEENGKIQKGRQILIIPSGNPYSMNISKRFWPTDNTDINRMFPGYDKGETTQRIAAGIFETVKEYSVGIQLASFYMPGSFVPHVRMMKTGFEDPQRAEKFGFPYVVLRTPKPYDTTTLNYNWQIWETQAYSIFTTTTEHIDKKSAKQAVEAILSFMSQENIVDYPGRKGYRSMQVEDWQMTNVRAGQAGIFECQVRAGEEIYKGEQMALIRNPYDGSIRETITAPVSGTVFFAHDAPLVYENTAVFKLI